MKKTDQEKRKEEKNKPNGPSAIVGIGASAGGLEAFSQLLKALPNNVGMTYIYIQHLDPKHKSTLPEILSKYCTMPVVQVKQNMIIVPNQVFVIPPDKYLSIKGQKLILSQRKKTDGVYLPIDYFFQSLASEKKNKAIGIILSGTASDGTLGLKAIKAEGGVTFAQDEASAKYPGMPVSAVDSGNVDFVLPPDKIAIELLRIGKHPYIIYPSIDVNKEAEPKEDGTLNQIFKKLRSVTDVDFSHYKLSTVKRRITRRMVLNKINNIENYLKFFKNDKNEVNELYHDLLINVTNFFRDKEVFKALAANIYPEIIENSSHDNPVRIWIPGCSTGEEAYSIAISFLEFLRKKSLNQNIQIFATDISESSIEKARIGIYPESISKDLSKELLRRYFLKSGNSYQISKVIRELCVFAKQDITKDPPFSRIDLICCRNLLIYISTELQKKIIPTLHYALKPKGYLLLGTSESIGGFADLFNLVDKKFKIYAKKQFGNRVNYNFNFTNPEYDKVEIKKLKDTIPDNLDIQKEADRIILSRYSPVGVLINQNFEIIQFRGKINQFLEPTPGNASLNLFKMMKEGLNLDLHTSIRKAQKLNRAVLLENIKINTDETIKIIDLEVIPIKAVLNPQEFFFLILFKDKSEFYYQPTKEKVEKRKSKTIKNDSKDIQIDRLRKELLVTKEHLQTIIEEREATNEELRSALEELQSSNEELQSTNEEMETAREELQSTNEELITVNDELESRNQELSEMNNDLNNLLSSINIPIIMLGNDLRIRRYTPRAERIWNLISGDIGRPITNLKPNIEVNNLKENILDVIDRLEIKEIEVKDNEQNWYSMKIRPYRTIENKIDGVVISLINVDTMKRGFDGAVENMNFIEAVFNTVAEPLFILCNDLKLKDANNSFYQKFNYKKEEVNDKIIFNLGNGEWNSPHFINFLKNSFEDKKVHNISFLVKTGSKEKNVSINSQKFFIKDKAENYLLLTIKEII